MTHYKSKVALTAIATFSFPLTQGERSKQARYQVTPCHTNHIYYPIGSLFEVIEFCWDYDVVKDRDGDICLLGHQNLKCFYIRNN